MTSIGDSAFGDCTSLKDIIFNGDVPSIGNEAFRNVTATAYYPVNNATWTKGVKQNYGGTITWVSNKATGLILKQGETILGAALDLDMAEGCTLTLSAEVQPALASQTVTWTSGNTAVATVDKTTGEVTLKKPGTDAVYLCSETVPPIMPWHTNNILITVFPPEMPQKTAF